MAGNSSIEWTEATWNPVTGCTKISSGCKHCYAERMAKRLKAIGYAAYRNGFQVTLHEHLLDLPLHWRQPRMIFVNSMSDLFHADVPMPFIQEIFQVMREADWHQFQILTKRSRRLASLSPCIDWPGNVWMGVTVESAEYTPRIDDLRKTGAALKFLSLEPLLTAVPSLNLEGIDWVIVGGESGPGARPMRAEWVTDIRKQCVEAGVPFFFKQWGGTRKKVSGRLLEGRTWDEMPVGAASPA
jgi:protein gp37